VLDGRGPIRTTMTILTTMLASLLPTCRPAPAEDAAQGTTSASATAEALPTGQASAISELHGFPLHPSLRPLCDGSVHSRGGMEIRWSILVSDHRPEELAAYYETRISGAALDRSAGQWTWRLPNAEAPQRVLSLTAPAAAVVPRDCDQALPPTARSVTNVSEMLRGK